MPCTLLWWGPSRAASLSRTSRVPPQTIVSLCRPCLSSPRKTPNPDFTTTGPTMPQTPSPLVRLQLTPPMLKTLPSPIQLRLTPLEDTGEEEVGEGGVPVISPTGDPTHPTPGPGRGDAPPRPRVGRPGHTGYHFCNICRRCQVRGPIPGVHYREDIDPEVAPPPLCRGFAIDTKVPDI